MHTRVEYQRTGNAPMGNAPGEGAVEGKPADITPETAVEVLSTILYAPSYTEDDLRAACAAYPELRELGHTLYTIRTSCSALANGDLKFTCKGRGYTIGNIKSIVSNLNFLAWQMRSMVLGEEAVTDPFLGEFSKVFNDLHAKLNEKSRELNELIDRYKLLAQTDTLTQLSNRRAFFDAAVRELQAARRKHTALSLIMLDVDHFKKVNDTYGHLVGDSVLVKVARLVSDCLRGEDFCARYGGEEFVALLRDADAGQACNVAERLRQACERATIVHRDDTIRVTISLGVAAIPVRELADLPAPKALEISLESVDGALYAAKENGRNRVFVRREDGSLAPCPPHNNALPREERT